MTFEEACRVSIREPGLRLRRLAWTATTLWWQWRGGGLWSVDDDAQYSIDPNDADMRGDDWVLG